jgi:hypothetical protein
MRDTPHVVYYYAMLRNGAKMSEETMGLPDKYSKEWGVPLRHVLSVIFDHGFAEGFCKPLALSELKTLVHY